MTRSPLPESRRPPVHSRTIADELAWASRKLASAGKSQPESLALNTWATLAGEKPGPVWLNRLAPVPSPGLVQRYRSAVGQQVEGAPFQSAVGKAAFRHLDLVIDASVLIPRVETEDLVEHVLVWCRHRAGSGGWGVAADIGTGSGAIALSLAVEGSFDRVIATDVSKEALAVTRRNLDIVQPRTPVEVREGSLLEPIGASECQVIVSNPPYVSTAEYERLDPEVRDYEPKVAFDGGPDGLDHYRSLLSEARTHLLSGGLLALEIDSRRSEMVLALALAAGWSDARIAHDVFDRPRYLLATNLEGTT